MCFSKFKVEHLASMYVNKSLQIKIKKNNNEEVVVQKKNQLYQLLCTTA